MKKGILVFLFFISTVFAFNAKAINPSVAEMMASCKITVTDNQTGKSYTLEVHDMTCDQFFRSLMRALLL